MLKWSWYSFFFSVFNINLSWCVFFFFTTFFPPYTVLWSSFVPLLLNTMCVTVWPSPIPQIRWRKVDGALPVHHEISMAGGILRLFNVQYEDEGVYECEALNSKGKDWHKANLYVEGRSSAKRRRSGLEWKIAAFQRIITCENYRLE